MSSLLSPCNDKETVQSVTLDAMVVSTSLGDIVYVSGRNQVISTYPPANVLLGVSAHLSQPSLGSVGKRSELHELCARRVHLFQMSLLVLFSSGYLLTDFLDCHKVRV